MELASIQIHFRRFILTVIACLLPASSLNAQNLSSSVWTPHQNQPASFSNYRSMSPANNSQYKSPQTSSDKLNKQLFANLSSGNPVRSVNYDSNVIETEQNTNPFYEQGNGCSCNSYSCRPPVNFTFKEDVHNFFPMIWEDTQQLINWKNGIYLGAALGGSLALRDSVDWDVRENVARHPRRWGKFSQALETIGNVESQVPVILGIYGYSLYQDDEKLHSFSNSLISAMTINGLSTIAVKAIANTDRPTDAYNDGKQGFPSYHASAMFTIASVVDEYYGHGYGLPAYTVAGLVGWSRIDMQRHDLSDVVFGAALGTVIGKGVAQFHKNKDCNYRVSPYIHPTSGGTGVMFELRF